MMADEVVEQKGSVKALKAAFEAAGWFITDYTMSTINGKPSSITLTAQVMQQFLQKESK